MEIVRDLRHSLPLATRLERATKCMKCVHMFIYNPHHIAIRICQRYLICFMDEVFSFRTINFVEKFNKVRQSVQEYVAKVGMQRDDYVKLLKVEIKDEHMKAIQKLIGPNLEEKFVPPVSSSISPTSRV